jgi:hypothetical protein
MGEPSSGADGAENRGQVGLTTAQQNARANAQERGSREVANMSAGVQASRDFGYSEPQAVEDGDFSIGDRSGESFVTSTQGALNDLNNRMGVGQMPGFEDKLFMPGGALVYAANEFGKTRAQDIQNKMNNGGTPVFDSIGRIQGVVTKESSPLFGDYDSYTGASNYDPTITGKQPSSGRSGNGYQMTDNDVRINEMTLGGYDGVGGNQIRQAAAIDPLEAARQRRAEAYNSRNSALTEAFGGFNDDYYSDLETAFRDVNTTGVQSQYDDAMRGIYQGFKQQGMFDQSDFDSRVTALNAQKAAEEARIGTAAKDYAEQQRKAIADQQSKLAKSLSGIMGGANTLEEIDAQTNNIGQFSFDSDIAKLKAAGPDAPAMDMFADFTKVAAPTLTGAAPANVAPISPSAFGGASQIVNTGGASGSSTGVASPFSGSSVKVL